MCKKVFIISIMQPLREVEIKLEAEVPILLILQSLSRIIFESCNCLIGLLLANQLIVIVLIVCNISIHSHVLN